jgi:ATP/maltotriose-dependent transcriptional regulator MalT
MALAHDRAGIEVGRKHHVIEAEVNSVINVIHDHACRGDLDNAESLITQAGNLLEQDEWFRWRFGLRLLAVRCERTLLQGDLVSAEASAWRLIETAGSFQARKYIVVGRNMLAAIAEARGDLDQAEVQLTAALAVLREYPAPLVAWKTHAALGRICLKSGNCAWATEAFKQAAALISMIAANIADERLKLTFLESTLVSKVLRHAPLAFRETG